jgi:hypothetical protein
VSAEGGEGDSLSRALHLSEVEATLHCARCDYDLRMLDPAGVCPECALPVAQSARAAAGLAGPLGLARATLLPGARLMLLAALIRFGLMLLGAAYAFPPGPYDVTGMADAAIAYSMPWPILTIGSGLLQMRWRWGWWVSFVVVVRTIEMLIELIGAWLLTRREPLPVYRAWSWRRLLRWGVRWSFIASVVIFVLGELFASRLPRLTGLEDDIRDVVVTLVMRSLPPAVLMLWAMSLLALMGERKRAHWLGWFTAASYAAYPFATEALRYPEYVWLLVALPSALATLAASTCVWLALFRCTRGAPVA